MPRNHDCSDPDFKLIPAAIHIEQGSWLAARAVVGPGVTPGEALCCVWAVSPGDRDHPMTIYPATPPNLSSSESYQTKNTIMLVMHKLLDY